MTKDEAPYFELHVNIEGGGLAKGQSSRLMFLPSSCSLEIKYAFFCMQQRNLFFITCNPTVCGNVKLVCNMEQRWPAGLCLLGGNTAAQTD